MKAITTTLFILFFGSFTLFAQHSISGKISDTSKESLPFANVILKEIGSDKNPKGAVSDENGNYTFENISSGKYILEISMLGFKSKKTDEFQLSANKTVNFTLEEESQTLGEVVVTAKRPVIRQTAEKLIVDLEKSEMININLQDVMRKIPGVLVTNNGLSVAGRSDVRILINGKTTEYMDIDTLLRDFPADNIAKIELVEQPGAEYDASGSGAIINIILKKNVRLGTHGSVNSWVGEDEGFEFGGGASIASYKNKLNWQAGINYSQPTWREDLFLVRSVGNQTYDQITREPYDPENFTLRGSIDYYINDKHSIGVGGRFSTRNSDRIASSTTIISEENNSDVLFSENSFDRERKNFNINPYYEYKTETDKFVVDFNFVDFTNNSTNTLLAADGSTISEDSRRYNQDGNYTIKTYRADYTKTFSDDFKLSFGSRFANVNTDNDLEALLEMNGTFNLLEDESSQFLIDENIFAVYTKVNANFGKWSFSGGLRYEDSNTDGTSIFMDNGSLQTQVRKRPISKLFPSASVSRKISETLGASLSYSYRIQRPSYNSLNAFATFLDFYSGNEGNPNLLPSFTNNYQFNLTYEGQPFFTVGYSTTDNSIFELIQEGNSPEQIRQQEVNVEDNTNWNFRLFAPLNLTKGMEGYTGIIVTNNDFKSNIFADANLNKWNLIWFVQASYKLPWDVNFELSGNYGTGALNGQIDVDWLADLDFSFGKKFLDDKLRVNLGFNKMLNRGFNGKIAYNGQTASVESNGSRQNVQLRLTYSFGSKFGKKKNRKTNRDEENRIQDNN